MQELEGEVSQLLARSTTAEPDRPGIDDGVHVEVSSGEEPGAPAHMAREPTRAGVDPLMGDRVQLPGRLHLVPLPTERRRPRRAPVGAGDRGEPGVRLLDHFQARNTAPDDASADQRREKPPSGLGKSVYALLIDGVAVQRGPGDAPAEVPLWDRDGRERRDGTRGDSRSAAPAGPRHAVSATNPALAETRRLLDGVKLATGERAEPVVHALLRAFLLLGIAGLGAETHPHSRACVAHWATWRERVRVSASGLSSADAAPRAEAVNDRSPVSRPSWRAASTQRTASSSSPAWSAERTSR